ncbi:hypothetical protein C7271_19755 [filamentous cyanobacterium CCP5]|nr:hypothetical protein C7271_19755 [filamentous cyanobacterium CCP5]
MPQASSPEERSAQADQVIQREILAGRPFSLAEAIGREGSDFLKGESPVPRVVQAKLAIRAFVSDHLQDTAGGLEPPLQTWLQAEDGIISQHLDSPLMALARILDQLLSQRDHHYELVRQADVCWGQLYDQRPHFQCPGQPPHPDDEYTHESVRVQLLALRDRVEQHLTADTQTP